MNRFKIFRWWLRGMFQRLRCWLLKPPAWTKLPNTALVFHVSKDGTRLIMIASEKQLPLELLPLGWEPPERGHYEVTLHVKLLSQQVTGEELLPDPDAPVIQPTLLRDLEDPTVKAGFWGKKPS